MKKEELVAQLSDKHQSFIDHMVQLNNEDFQFRPNPEKWSNGENLVHILQSTKPLGQALLLPKFQMKIMFGKANRPSKTYDGLVEKYKEKLAVGGKASAKYTPKQIAFEERNDLVGKLTSTVKKITNRMSRFSEEDLDNYILPHPLLGKLTFREMMYFTIYHVQHHHQIVEMNINSTN